jgi:hypothetical protein
LISQKYQLKHVLLVLVVTFSLYIYILKKQKRGKCPYQVFTYGTHVRVVACSGLPGVLAGRWLLAWLAGQPAVAGMAAALYMGLTQLR